MSRVGCSKCGVGTWKRHYGSARPVDAAPRGCRVPRPRALCSIYECRDLGLAAGWPGLAKRPKHAARLLCEPPALTAAWRGA